MAPGQDQGPKAVDRDWFLLPPHPRGAGLTWMPATVQLPTNPHPPAQKDLETVRAGPRKMRVPRRQGVRQFRVGTDTPWPRSGSGDRWRGESRAGQ